MNLKKSTLTLTLASILGTSTTQAAIIDMTFDGLFTMLDSAGNAFLNSSKPYYYDSTWGYGYRTQISGKLQYDTDSGHGTASTISFNFLSAGQATIDNLEYQRIGSDLLLGNFDFSWNGSDITSQIVLDGSGLFAELDSVAALGAIYDTTTCTISGACATPASNGIRTDQYPIGPVPIATSSLNTSGQTGFGTTLDQLSLGTDDGIGGSPMDNGPFSGVSINLDLTSITVTDVSSVPVPAAVWLFGSGLIALTGLSRRRKSRL